MKVTNEERIDQSQEEIFAEHFGKLESSDVCDFEKQHMLASQS